MSASDAVAESSRVLAVVTVGHGAPRLPDECAGCGGTASTSDSVGFGPRALSVPYCAPCLEHAAVARTRALAASLASVLLAGTFTAGAPLLWPWATAAAVTLGAVLVSGLPFVLNRWILPRLRPRAAVGRAVFFTRRGELACRRPGFAERVAALTPTARVRAVRRAEPLGPTVLLGPILAVVAGPALHRLHHPLVRILDLTPEPFVVEVDGRRVAEVVGSSREDPEAGVELRLPAGRRRLVARTRAGSLAEDRVQLKSGRPHLYAPGPHQRCFWLETTRYGRQGSTAMDRTVLPADRSFWVLPSTVDTWFAGNPAGPGEGRSSGGVLTALRQGRCRDLPASAAVER